MENPQDQSGTLTPANAGRTPQSSAAPASRKPAAPDAQSTLPTPDAQAQTMANAGAGHQGEGQPTNGPEGTLLDTALNSGKKWIEDSGVLNSVNQLPQSLKDLGSRALDKVNGLSTTQKVVGGTILAVGLGWLATRKGKAGRDDSSPYNYGNPRGNNGSYGRRTTGYQAPDAATSRRPVAGSGRTDSGAAYASTANRYSSGFGSDTGNTGIKSGSGASAATDHGASGRQAGHDGLSSIE